MVLAIIGATLAVCLGCVALPALLLALPLTVAGGVTGHVALRQIRERGEEGRGMALTGVAVGWSATVLAAVPALFTLVVIGLGFATGPGMSPG